MGYQPQEIKQAKLLQENPEAAAVVESHICIEESVQSMV